MRCQDYYLSEAKSQHLRLLPSNLFVSNHTALFGAVGTREKDLVLEPGKAKEFEGPLTSTEGMSRSFFIYIMRYIADTESKLPRTKHSGIERAVEYDNYLLHRHCMQESSFAIGHEGQHLKF